MRTHFRLIGIGAAVVLAAFVLAQDSWTLKRVPTVGQVSKYRLKAEIELGGMQATLSGVVVDKITAVEADGAYAVESTQSDLKVLVMDNEMEVPESGATTIKYGSRGEVLEIKGEKVDGSTYRMANLSAFRFPDRPVKVGDEWTVEVPADATTGTAKSTATYKVEGVEMIGERQAIKVHMTYKEVEGSEMASSDSVIWLDLKDGNMIKVEATWSNAPLPEAPGPITAKVTLTLEG